MSILGETRETTEVDRFKDISVRKRTHCVICDTKLSDPIIKMPKFPLTEIYVTQKVNEGIGFIDQEFLFCRNCGHGQISNVIDQNILYGQNYKTRTSTSPSASQAVDIFLDFVKNIIRDCPIKTILEIGCNDLYTLQKLRDKADILYGVDPILKNNVGLFRDDKIKLIGDFFEKLNLKELGIKTDVILSSHTLEHIEEPKRLIQGLMADSLPDTLFFFQFPGLESLVQDCRFDQVFHQHLNYFSIKSVLYMLRESGAELIDLKLNPYHWGSLMIAFTKSKCRHKQSNRKFENIAEVISDKFIQKQFEVFKDCMEITSKRIHALHNETIYGYGAALMLPVLDYYIKELRQLRYIIDDDVNKKDLYYLNVPIQIKSPEQIQNIEDSIIVVTAINSLEALRSIVKKVIQLHVKQIIIPTNAI